MLAPPPLLEGATLERAQRELGVDGRAVEDRVLEHPDALALGSEDGFVELPCRRAGLRLATAVHPLGEQVLVDACTPGGDSARVPAREGRAHLRSELGGDGALAARQLLRRWRRLDELGLARLGAFPARQKLPFAR